MHDGYEQQPITDGRVRFSVIPGPPPRPAAWPWALAAALGALVAAAAPVGITPLAVLARAAAGVAIAALPWPLMRWRSRARERRRSPGGSFVVSRFGIEAAGRRLARRRIRRLLIAHAERDVLEALRIGRDPLHASAGGPPSVAQALGVPADARYLLRAEADDGAWTLAGGMTRATAQGLLADVSRILGDG